MPPSSGPTRRLGARGQRLLRSGEGDRFMPVEAAGNAVVRLVEIGPRVLEVMAWGLRRPPGDSLERQCCPQLLAGGEPIHGLPSATLAIMLHRAPGLTGTRDSQEDIGRAQQSKSRRVLTTKRASMERGARGQAGRSPNSGDGPGPRCK